MCFFFPFQSPVFHIIFSFSLLHISNIGLILNHETTYSLSIYKSNTDGKSTEDDSFFNFVQLYYWAWIFEQIFTENLTSFWRVLTNFNDFFFLKVSRKPY
jgi:hypothetical protein